LNYGGGEAYFRPSSHQVRIGAVFTFPNFPAAPFISPFEKLKICNVKNTIFTLYYVFCKKVVYMSKKSILAVFVLSAAVFSTSAFAQGMYIAGSAGLGMAASSVKTDSDAAISLIPGVRNLNTSVANGTAMDGTLGYAFSPNFAAEAGYFNSGTLAYSGTFTGGTVRSDIKITGFRLAVVGIAPLSDQFSVFGKLGWGMYTNDSAATVTVGTVAVTASDSVKKNSVGYGAGVMYKLVDNVSLRASYEMIGSDVSAFLVGVQFKF